MENRSAGRRFHFCSLLRRFGRRISADSIGRPAVRIAVLVLSIFTSVGSRVDAAADDKEAEMLKEVKIPDGFEATIFASPPQVNYPTFLAAAPGGDLYVSVDKNSSLNREPGRGSVLRLRDTDGDGRADEITRFIDNVDSPRGLVWDHDRLYLMHPPHLSAFIDNDGDGVSDEQQILVKNIAFGFKDRPADHTSNGVTLGIDGWLYLAIGDFGFMQAEGADGRKLQLRGGGVVRVRPDGSGMEIFSRGTRNILEVALDPLLNGFTRDNTNDGGGWDIRLHHFTGFENHGYPLLFMNFTDEAVAPLADYGGGSGCGSLYLSEPGFPEGFRDALYTADWGNEIVYRHHLTPNGATFSPDQTEFIRLPRVTDLDVDAMSRLYIASWKGATYSYVGENVGYLIQVKPTGYTPRPLPDFGKLPEGELVALLAKTPSHRRRLEVQRELLRRGTGEPVVRALAGLARDENSSMAARVAALFALKQGMGEASHAVMVELAKVEALRPFAVRALTDRWDQLGSVPTEPIVAALRDDNPRTRLEAAVALARLGDSRHAGELGRLLADPDPVVRHTAVQTLVALRACDVSLAIFDSSSTSSDANRLALRVLQRLNQEDVVKGVTDRLAKETDSLRRRGLLRALCRLHFREGPWKGNSWGTRPDTRGPYYQPETWRQSERIAGVLSSAFAAANSEEADYLLGELGRHRIYLDSILTRMIAMAEQDSDFVPAAVRQLVQSSRVPEEAISLLSGVAGATDGDGQLRTQAQFALIKTRRQDAIRTVMTSLAAAEALDGNRRPRRGGVFSQLTGELLKPDLWEGNLDMLMEHVETTPGTAWADAVLLVLSTDNGASPAARELAGKSLETGWADPSRRLRILRAVMLSNHREYEGKVRAAMQDPDKRVADLANRLARRWRLRRETSPTGPAIKSLKPEAVIASVVTTKGNRNDGEALYVRLQCANCHTVKADEPLRGPYLPNVVKTYKRDQLAESILLPGKTIAQGFVTNAFILEDGRVLSGFVTSEADERVTIRDGEGKEFTIRKDNIEERVRQEMSLMPTELINELTVKELASLLDYLQSLAE